MHFAGDQEDVNLLNEIVEDAAQFSGYDMIVDDGGHKASQMLASFRVSPCASLNRLPAADEALSAVRVPLISIVQEGVDLLQAKNLGYASCCFASAKQTYSQGLQGIYK